MQIAIASRSPLVRAGLAKGLGARHGITVVLAAETFAALHAASFGGAAVAVIDLGAVSERVEADAGAPAIAVEGPRVIVLAEPGDERTGE